MPNKGECWNKHQNQTEDDKGTNRLARPHWKRKGENKETGVWKINRKSSHHRQNRPARSDNFLGIRLPPLPSVPCHPPTLPQKSRRRRQSTQKVEDEESTRAQTRFHRFSENPKGHHIEKNVRHPKSHRGSVQPHISKWLPPSPCQKIGRRKGQHLPQNRVGGRVAISKQNVGHRHRNVPNYNRPRDRSWFFHKCGCGERRLA